jgi:glycosyltransferase involved in cell wall biosynthesis
MRVLLTIHHLLDKNAGAPGGVLRLAEVYRSMGHEVNVLSFDDMPKKIPRKLVQIVFPWFVLRRVGRMARELDVIDASSGDAWVCLERRAWQRGAFRRPLFVTHSHGLEHSNHLQERENARRGLVKLSWKYPLYHGGFRLREVTRSFRRADLALFLNQHDLQYAVEKLGVPRERARLTANGLSSEFLNLPFERTPDAAEGSVRIAQVSTYLPRKGIQYGVPALGRILSRYPEVRVSFFGTGCPAENVLRDFAPDVRDRVHVVSSFDNDSLPVLLRGHQIKLLPTLSEGLSVALLEAMSCGLSPVTTDVPGASDLVEPEVDGLVVPARDPAAIEEALRRLIEDRSLLDRLRRNAYEKAQVRGWAKVAAERLALYKEFSARRRAGPP